METKTKKGTLKTVLISVACTLVFSVIMLFVISALSPDNSSARTPVKTSSIKTSKEATRAEDLLKSEMGGDDGLKVWSAGNCVYMRFQSEGYEKCVNRAIAGNKHAKDLWNSARKNYKKMYSALAELLAARGCCDVFLQIEAVDNKNVNKPLLILNNGKISYDIAG